MVRQFPMGYHLEEPLHIKITDIAQVARQGEDGIVTLTIYRTITIAHFQQQSLHYQVILDALINRRIGRSTHRDIGQAADYWRPIMIYRCIVKRFLFLGQRLENDGVEQFHVLFADHKTAAGQIGDMRVVTDTEPACQLLDVLFDREFWFAPSPDMGASASTLGKVNDAERLDEPFFAYLLPELLRQALLVDVDIV